MSIPSRVPKSVFIAVTHARLLCAGLGFASIVAAAQTPTFYQDPVRLPLYEGGQYTWAFRLNDQDVVVGYVHGAGSAYSGVLWTGLTAHPMMLVGPGGSQYLASGINNANQAVGGFYSGAYGWADPLANWTLPAMPLANDSFVGTTAAGVNDPGNVVGYAVGTVGPYRAVSPYPYPIFWTSDVSTPTILKLPSADYCATSTCRALDINDRQEIVGDRCSAGSCDTLYWAGPDAVPTQLPDGSAAASAARGPFATKDELFNLVAYGINNAGQIVGASLVSPNSNAGTPLVWLTRTAAGPTELPLGDLIYGLAFGINNHGTVSGVGYDLATGATVPVVWQPVPNYQGLWWKFPAGSESGWGVNINHEGDTIFITWYTFDLNGNPWWLVMAATETAPGSHVFTGKLYSGTGPPFNAQPFDPNAVQPVEVGTGTFTFTDENNGTFEYTVNGVHQSKAITKETFGAPVPRCIWGAEPNLALVVNKQALWWAKPAGSESGWGINFTQQGNVIFASWFTFDLNGNPWWLVVTATETAPGSGVYTGDLYSGTGPPFNAEPFDPNAVKPVKAGTATFTFSDGNNATFDYTVNGIEQSKAITREVLGAVPTMCQQ